MSVDVKTIDTLLEERRTFPPAEDFRKRARVTDDSLHRAAAADPEAFWGEMAKPFHWFAPPQNVSCAWGR